jgi:hypothetical protein
VSTLPRNLRFFSVGSVLTRTVSNWWENIVSYTLLSCLVHAPLAIFTYVYLGRPIDDEAALIYQLILVSGGGLLGFVLTSVIAPYVFYELRADPKPLRRCIGDAATRLPAIIGVSLLTLLATAVGLLLLVVPGILWYCMFWLAIPAVVIERRGTLASLKRSRILTMRLRGSIFGVLLVVWLIEQAIGVLVGTALVSLSAGANLVAGLILLMLASPVTGVAAAVAYHDIRVYKEGLDIRDLVEVFE